MSKRTKTQHAPQTLRDLQQPKARKLSWIESATDIETLCAIPVIPRFQADLPNWTGNHREPDSEKWLGQQIWPLQENKETSNGSNQGNHKEIIGKGRPEICSCQYPGSVECVKLHVSEERNKLRTELGPAFEEWKFDEMGEEASKGWTSRDRNRFTAMVRRNLSSEDMSFVEKNWKSFRGKDRRSLVSYYFNVHIPRQICKQTRSGCTEVQTDDDDDASESEKLGHNYNSQKKVAKSEMDNDDEASKSRRRWSIESQGSAKDIGKNKYLSGRR